MVIGSPFDIIIRNFKNDRIRIVMLHGKKAHLSFPPPRGVDTRYGVKLCGQHDPVIMYMPLSTARLERWLLEGKLCKTCIKLYGVTFSVVDTDGEWFDV